MTDGPKSSQSHGLGLDEFSLGWELRVLLGLGGHLKSNDFIFQVETYSRKNYINAFVKMHVHIHQDF